MRKKGNEPEYMPTSSSSRTSPAYDTTFKHNAVQFRQDNPALTFVQTAHHLGISTSALKRWYRLA